MADRMSANSMEQNGKAPVLDVQELGVIIQGGILTEYEMPYLRDQIPHADRIRRPYGERAEDRHHLIIRSASLPEPAQNEPVRGHTDLGVIRIQEPAVEAEEKLSLIRTAQVIGDLRQAVQQQELCEPFPAG